MRPGRGTDPPPHLVPKVLEKSGAVSVLTGRVYVAYKKCDNLPIQGDRRESDGLKKKYSVDFQLEMDVFLQN